MRFVCILAGLCLVFCFALLLPTLSTPVHADGGAPNLAYVANTSKGISIINIAQQKVTGNIAVSGDPQTIILSVDGRLLYVTQPSLKRIAIIATYTKATVCTAAYPGHPSLLTLDPGTNTLYAAGTDAAVVEAIDPMSCAIRQTLKVSNPVQGLAVAIAGGSILGGNNNHIWVASTQALTIFDSAGKQLANVPMAEGPHYISIPPGSTAYVTTQQGTVDAVDLQSHKVIPRLLSGGSFGPMDFDETTGQVYVPDKQNMRIDVLSPISSGSSIIPHEPLRVIPLQAAPQAIAITSDGQLGFAAVQDGTVVMLDIPGKAVVTTFQVGGQPHFIITGLYASIISLTPQQATILSVVENLSHYAAAIIIVVATAILVIVNRRRNRLAK